GKRARQENLQNNGQHCEEYGGIVPDTTPYYGPVGRAHPGTHLVFCGSSEKAEKLPRERARHRPSGMIQLVHKTVCARRCAEGCKSKLTPASFDNASIYQTI
ncbi:MAG: hypothetical protein MI753_04375, partial [Hyphomicrobiales bacterium]|nr:hypothetical protein [Hyphomicrobiales bacterium]